MQLNALIVCSQTTCCITEGGQSKQSWISQVQIKQVSKTSIHQTNIDNLDMDNFNLKHSTTVIGTDALLPITNRLSIC
jgi:hypothetical protein